MVSSFAKILRYGKIFHNDAKDTEDFRCAKGRGVWLRVAPHMRPRNGECCRVPSCPVETLVADVRDCVATSTEQSCCYRGRATPRSNENVK